MELRARFGWHDGIHGSTDIWLPVVDVLQYGRREVVVKVLGPAGAQVRTVDPTRLEVR